MFCSFQVSVYCCTAAATVRIFPRADPTHAWTTDSVVCTPSLTVLRDTRVNARETSQAKDVKLRYHAPPNHVVPVDSASIIRLVCVAHVKPCLHVSFVTPFWYHLKMVQCSPMVLYTHNAKKIKGASHRNSDVEGMRKWGLKLSFLQSVKLGLDVLQRRGNILLFCHHGKFHYNFQSLSAILPL